MASQNIKPDNQDLGTESLAKVLVDRRRINHNLDQFSGEHELAPVIKSNAYGHGLELVAESIAERSDVSLVCVAALREARRLLESDCDVPVLIIGYTSVAAITACELSSLTFTITSFDQLKKLDSKLTNRRSFHLKVETGMHRYGIKPENIKSALEIIKSNNYINLTGAFSHFSDAYEPDSQFTRTQIKRWNRAAKIINQSTDVNYLHMAATSGHFYRQKIFANTERVGIGMYGVTSYASQLKLKPALSLQTKITTIKQVPAGSWVGYNRSFQADTDMVIAVLPLGYQEGVDRRLSNTGIVLVNGEACPIVGKVSMNATIIDITSTENVSLGDNATVLSANPQAPNSVLTVANKIGTIPYEILVHISPELKRAIITFD